jgi:Transposase DDE domain
MFAGSDNCVAYIFADSTKLAVCHNRRIHSKRVFKGKAARGKTSTGWFYGLKLFLVINAFGEIMNAFFHNGQCGRQSLANNDKIIFKTKRMGFCR